ncbi:strictosidine synthase family protein [Oleiphilus messinensis]|uniref:Strictosidine synthase family protein n=1 Tax=Oleiphilus messinensis TaxID=141451 RepID=A0A1Y0IC70_9GAMM|nr:SMP-30/gluconolactonase/LRE family protein [Oleiphilus messinensis]ARU56973.1 strictosidine synthase family protein [Oleiphilus messinensis]
MRIFLVSIISIVSLLTLAVFIQDPETNNVNAWQPPVLDPNFAKTANNALGQTHRIPLDSHAPEDVAVDPHGNIFTGTADGAIYRINPDNRIHKLTDTGGRPLGMKFYPAGSDKEQNLVVADAAKGLLEISPEGEIKTLTSDFQGIPYGLIDDLDISTSGDIYFTDASKTYPLESYIKDIISHGDNGAFYVYRNSTKQVELLADGLFFANGVALSPDETYVLVVETSKYRVLRYWLEGPQKGQIEVFVDNLPGAPDGIMGNGQNQYWLSLAAPRKHLLDAILPWPKVRSLMLALPTAMLPGPDPVAWVLKFNQSGEIVANLNDPDGRAFHAITNVIEYKDQLIFGSLAEDAVGVFKLNMP